MYVTEYGIKMQMCKLFDFSIKYINNENKFRLVKCQVVDFFLLDILSSVMFIDVRTFSMMASIF